MEKDEEKLLNRRRLEKWIKIFLLFLAFVWLCTIISKSIYVSGLTIVKTDTPSKKYVEHIVEADGIVTTGGEIAVNTLAGLRVDRLYVMQGDEVKTGDVLFTIDTSDIAGIIREKETELTKMQANLLDMQVNAVIDAQKKEVEILWAQEDYETADKETAIAKERAKEALDKAESELEKHLADTVPYTSDNTRQKAWDDYHDWVNRGYGISDRIIAKQREIQDLEEQFAELGQQLAEPGQQDSGKEPEDKEPEAEEPKDGEPEDGEPEDGEPEDEEQEDGESEDEDMLDNDTDTISGDISEDDAERTKLQDRIKQAKGELLALQDEQTKHDRNAVEQPDYSAEEIKLDEWQNTRLALEANVQRAKENYNDVSYSREVTLRQKMRDIARAQVTTRADSTAANYELDMKQIQTQLASLYSLQKQKGEIKAEYDGIISKIQIEVGSRTADMASILMTDTQRPCQFKFSITKEQGKYVHLNDTVSLKLNGQSAMDVTVDYFTENMQGGYDLVCMLPEGVGKPGLSGSIQRSVQGEYHELTLPVDAVVEESNGTFVYILNEKEGLLGSEYYAEKIKVQVKDKNDRFVALESGTIGADAKVITYATKELKQGESVRPQDQ